MAHEFQCVRCGSAASLLQRRGGLAAGLSLVALDQLAVDVHGARARVCARARSGGDVAGGATVVHGAVRELLGEYASALHGVAAHSQCAGRRAVVGDAMKINAQILRDYLAVHSWVGIVCGLLLYVAFYAGAFSMLEPEIRQWTQKAVSKADVSADPDRALQQFLVQHPDAKGRLSLRLPGADSTTPLIRLSSRESEHWYELRNDGKVHEAGLGKESDNAGNFVDYLHRKGGLPLPLDWAEPVIGVVSLLYALALVSGVVVLLPSLVKDLFYLRIGPNIKRMWLDVHNLLGVASLPFHLVIALSAAVFGLHDWIYDAQDKFIYRDGLQATVQRDSIKHPVVDKAQWLAPTELIRKVREQVPGFEPQSLDFVGMGGKRTFLLVTGTDDRYFKRGAQHGFAFVNPGTGQIYDRIYFPGEKSNALSASLVSFFSLHFGSFGGDPVRVLYVLLGLSGALIFYTGNLLWIETRTKRLRTTREIEARPRHVRIMSSATLGICVGCAAALPATLVASRLLAPHMANVDGVHQWTFYLLLAGCLVYAFRFGAQRAATALLWVAAAGNALVPLLAWLQSLAPSLFSDSEYRTHQPQFLLFEGLCALLALFFGWLAMRHKKQA
ncbi:PepSY-associated TM helix domain-containing protein [Diaphorobacter caeni]|uniref:PepSY-associated TM helix domain-containing protein n=1 Tax=Diaphorobacter caeni TaxID=2784387 RepID=UPI001890B1B3|nr:PepSY-associated TM helix domain-containing protein [Diaphorobacter caeni]MBF5003156.1 PepSY domain-containing protein [Diaphorobacter caeni]